MIRYSLLAMVLASPAAAGGLAPAVSPIPPERPTHAPLIEPQRCERPVYGRDGSILYWTGNGCVPEVVDGGPGPNLPRPKPFEPPKPYEPPRNPPVTGHPCKGFVGPYKPGC